MGVRQQIRGLAFNAFLSGHTRRARGRAHDIARRLRRRQRRVDLYYQVDDPYSHLLVQVVPRLAQRYGLEIGFYLIPAPGLEINPEPERRCRYAARDARELAAYFDVEFPDGPELLDPDVIERASRVLACSRSAVDQIAAAFVASFCSPTRRYSS